MSKLFGNKLGYCDCCYHPNGSQEKVRLKTSTYRMGPGTSRRTQDLCEKCSKGTLTPQEIELSRKSKLVDSRTGKSPEHVKGSLRAYVVDYEKAGFTTEQAECMGQLAYGQKTLRKRLEAIEALALAGILGAVEIDTKLHLLSCAKRKDKTLTCNCGAEP